MKVKRYFDLALFFALNFALFVLSWFFMRLVRKTVSEKYNSVLYLENFPTENSGFQYRANRWVKLLCEKGINAKLLTIVTERKKFEAEYNSIYHGTFFLKSLLKRFKQCLQARSFQIVIVRRELLLYNDYGNLFMEKFLLTIHPNVILDFDDDIAASKGEPRKVTSWFGRLMLENGNKFNDSLRLYKRFIVASNYLKEKVLCENPSVDPKNILVMPTCVDYNSYEPKVYDMQKTVITFGWIGGNQNLPYLQEIIPAMNYLARQYAIELLVISGKTFEAETDFPLINRPWSLEKEVDDLKTVDVGLMPLPLNDRTKGKGGFKLIQYMGLGIVSVASAITINKEIIEDGVNGFLVEPEQDWAEVLEKVMHQRAKFPTFAQNAREKIMKGYTFEANFEAYKDFLNFEQ